MKLNDIAITLENNCFDIRFKKGDWLNDDGLETAVIISLFTDKRVTDEQLPEFTKDKKGWWGDLVPLVDQDQIGSRLWTLARSKVTNETLKLHEDYAKEALQFLIEDGIASEINVSTSYNDNLHLLMEISILRPNREETNFNLLWDQQSVRILNKDINNGV